jgi:predicted CXXCH cytochrome family protein
MTLRPLLLAAPVVLLVHCRAHEGKKGRLAPLADPVVSTHGPFEAGECKLCHQRSDRGNPGRPTRTGNQVCFDCHDEFEGTATRNMRHASPRESCTTCHNPHNSRREKLLL